MIPFNYPRTPHKRLHGPSGYKGYESYRDWLRDEFLFRCVYCLRREQWGLLMGAYHIDHFLPKAHHPHLASDYDNLLYCCNSCNLAKGDENVPNPEHFFFQPSVNVYEDGSIEGTTSDARRIIRKLGLDSRDYVDYRFNWIGIIQLAENYDDGLYRRMMGYPDPLPNLASKQNKANSRPDGVTSCCFALQERQQLPEVYL